MNEMQLLDALKSEMLLARARAEGAQMAYEWQAQYVAQKECSKLGLYGKRLHIAEDNGIKIALFHHVEFEKFYVDGDEEPVLYGYFILKSGLRSKVQSRLCTLEQVRGGLVKLSNKDKTK